MQVCPNIYFHWQVNISLDMCLLSVNTSSVFISLNNPKLIVTAPAPMSPLFIFIVRTKCVKVNTTSVMIQRPTSDPSLCSTSCKLESGFGQAQVPVADPSQNYNFSMNPETKEQVTKTCQSDSSQSKVVSKRIEVLLSKLDAHLEF